MALTLIAFLLVAVVAQGIASDLPSLTLPWGTWQATSYDPNGDFYTFDNVRFGKAPVNELRFQKSVFPDAISNPSQLQPSEGSPCFQCDPSNCNSSVIDVPPQIPGAPLPSKPESHPSEDCLFADLYVPRAAFAEKAGKIPIVNWIYGGGFIFGAKDGGFGDQMPFYEGTGLLRTAHAAGKDFILVTGNYRMGAFGWLAGPSMEKHATPNAGLWDQRLLLDFIKTFAPRFGGNASDIGVWGESAGGGSILHHLTSSQPPVFGRALLQSPAYLWQWDRSDRGYASRIFTNLTQELGCPSTGQEAISCMQKANSSVLQKWNKAIILRELHDTGLIPFNPAVDGSLIVDLPTVSFAKGNIWKNITSLLLSHVADESKSFVPNYITSDATFTLFLSYFMPGPQYTPHRASIAKQYSTFKNPHKRAHAVIQDSSFTCNTRFAFDAYNHNNAPPNPPTTTRLYMMQYNFLSSADAAIHAADLIPTFYKSDLNTTAFYAYMHKISKDLSDLAIWGLLKSEERLAPVYQHYLATFGATGTPGAMEGNPEWKTAVVTEGGEKVGRVMETGNWVTTVVDAETVDEANAEGLCGFWRNMSGWVQESAAREARGKGSSGGRPDGRGGQVRLGL